MKIIELILEEGETEGVFAISTVEQPAIESNFIALNKEPLELATVNEEKRILMGAALIPNKTIFRKNGDQEFYVYFSKDTIKQASEMFLKKGAQSAFTMEHDGKLSGLTVVESWLVEDKDKDKSSIYNFNVPVGTWMVSVKVDNDDVWENYVKTGKVKGFSIEGYFADRTELKAVEPSESDKKIEALKELLKGA